MDSLNRNTYVLFIYFTLLFVITNTFFFIRFEENDDVCMLLISSGKYGTMPDNHLVFINFLIGTFLNWLYIAVPKIEWYTILLIAFNILSFTFILSLLLKRHYSVLYKIILFLFLTSFFFYFSINLQFTRTSALLSIAGLSLIYSSKKKHLGSALFLIGSLLRFEASIFILILSLPLFILKINGIKKFFQDKKIRALIFAVSIASICKIADYSYYLLDSDWKDYVEYNQVRGKINDNPNASIEEKDLPKGILLSDYKLLMYATTNPEVITFDQLVKIHHSINKKTFYQKLRNISALSKYTKYILMLALIATLFLLQEKQNRIQVLLFLITFLLTISFLTINSTLKERVFFPAFFGIVTFLLLLKQLKESKTLHLILLTILLSSFIITHKAYFIGKKNYIQRVIFNQQTEMINDYVKNNKKLVPIGASYRVEFGSPFHCSLNFPSQKFFWGGWLTNIPLNNGVFDSFNFFIDGYGILVENKNMEIIDHISTSIYNKYGVEVTPSIIVNKHNISIVELKTKSELDFIDS